jgi:hypothetical protein
MDSQKRIVEINGVKIEVDLRTAKRVEEFRVGSPVKVLKKTYGESYSSHFGMIVGFDEFKSLPTIIVAFLNSGRFETSPIEMAYINDKTTEVEICAHDPSDLGVERVDIEDMFNREINKRNAEITELRRKQRYFNEMFGRYFPTPELKANA